MTKYLKLCKHDLNCNSWIVYYCNYRFLLVNSTFTQGRMRISSQFTSEIILMHIYTSGSCSVSTQFVTLHSRHQTVKVRGCLDQPANDEGRHLKACVFQLLQTSSYKISRLLLNNVSEKKRNVCESGALIQLPANSVTYTETNNDFDHARWIYSEDWVCCFVF